MTSKVSIAPYSKRSVFVSEPEDEDLITWCSKTLYHLGATQNKSIDRPGWILPMNKEDVFRSQLRAYTRAQRSRDPKVKRQRSRAGGNTKIEIPVVEDSKEFTEDKASFQTINKATKPSQVSYINWDEETALKINDEFSLSDEEKHSHSRNSSSYGESESDSSDDESIQTVLARKMKNESSGKHIQEENIADSDLEDCVSFARRLRHIYNLVGKFDKRLKVLEEKLQISSE